MKIVTAHIVPRDDLVEHEISSDCVCQPRLDVQAPLTSQAPWEALWVHSSLDGRELEEI